MHHRPCHRRTPAIFTAALALVLCTASARAQEERPDVVLDLVGQARPLVRLAHPATPRTGVTTAAAVAREMDETLRSDLELSRIFAIQGPTQLAVLDLTGDETRDNELYRSLGNEYVLTTGIEQQGDKIALTGRLMRLDSGEVILTKRYRGELTAGRRIAHTLADEIVSHFSGQRGVALTQIAFVSDRTAEHQIKEIYLMDYDGWNQRPVTAHQSLSLSPDWSSDGEHLAYVTYVRGTPGIFLANLRSGRKQDLITEGTLNSSPSFAPDGRRFAFARSVAGGNTEIFLANRDGSGLRQLTYSPGIDTNPAWSPSGRDIAFTSSRSGSPQIYVMDSEGANLRRLSTSGSYNDGAAWNPEGTHLVYATRRGNGFDLAVTSLVSLETFNLTSGPSSDETPCFSPDGRKIAFASSRQYGGQRETQIYVIDADGSNLRQLTREGNNYGPSWSGYLP